MAFYQTSDFRNGIKVLIDGNPYVMTYFQFVKPGKGTAFTRTKLKNLITGSVIERTYRTGETLEVADCEDVAMVYQWNDGDLYYFMNTETFEQVGVPGNLIEDKVGYLLDELQVMVTMFNGRPMGIELPNFIEAEITYCEPGAKGNTATGASKPATLSSGAQVQVPLFVEQGEWIRVDTREGKYVQRVNKP